MEYDNKMINLEIWVRTKIFNPKGEIVKEQYFRSGSFLVNYAKLIGAILGYRSDEVLDEGGIARTIMGYAPYDVAGLYRWRANVTAGNNDASYGIIAGTGDTPVGVEDYKLASKIGHGVGAGLFDYEPCSVSSVSYTPDWSRIIISRSFVNLSGATITVKEIGLKIYHHVTWADVDKAYVKFLVFRDVLPTPDDVPDGYTYSVSYEIRWSV